MKISNAAYLLNTVRILEKILIISIVFNLGFVITGFAQQTCTTKGNYPLPEISQSARNKIQQDLDLATEKN
jgi:hypothetical protein